MSGTPSTTAYPLCQSPGGELTEMADLLWQTSDSSVRIEGVTCDVQFLAPTSLGRPCDRELITTAELEEIPELESALAHVSFRGESPQLLRVNHQS